MLDKKPKEVCELNKKIKDFYDNHAKELTEKYLKDHPDLKFVHMCSIDESGIPTITMKLVKKEENSNWINSNYTDEE